MEDKQTFKLLKGGHHGVSFLKPKETIDITCGGDNVWLNLGFSLEEAELLEKEYQLAENLQDCFQQLLEEQTENDCNSRLCHRTLKNRTINLIARHLDCKPSFITRMLKGRKSELSLNDLSACLFKLRGFNSTNQNQGGAE